MAWDDGGEILALGEGEALRARYPDAHHIDAHGAVLVPGLIDAHAHLMGLAMALSGVDLVGASSKAEVVPRLPRFAADLPPGARQLVVEGKRVSVWVGTGGRRWIKKKTLTK